MRMLMKSTVLVIFSTILCLFFGVTRAYAVDTAAAAVSDKAVYGVDSNYAPFAYVEGNKAVGFETELVKLIFSPDEYNLRLDLRYTWDEMYNKTKKQELDICGPLVKTSQREKEILFSDLAYTRYYGSFTSADSGEILFKDLAKYKLGAVKGYYGEVIVRETLNAKDYEIFNTYEEMLRAIKENRITAAIDAIETMKYYIRKDGLEGQVVLQRDGIFHSDAYFGIARNRPDLVDYINQRLKEIKRSGEYEILYIKSFSNHSKYYYDAKNQIYNYVIAGIVAVVILFYILSRIYISFLKRRVLKFQGLSKAIVDNATVMICQWNAEGSMLFFNNFAETITGYSEHEVLQHNWETLFFDDSNGEDKIKILESLKKPQDFDPFKITIKTKNKNNIILLWSCQLLSTVKSGKMTVVSFGTDITTIVENEEKLRYSNDHDNLTGLYNRRFYEEQIERLDCAHNLPITLAMGDVNGLKLINDSFGNAAGDEILKKVAEILKKECTGFNIAARFGGDEFVIIFPKTNNLEAEENINRIKELISLEKVQGINISVSFGFETKVFVEESIQSVIKNTEDHMNRHKIYENYSMRSKTIDLIMKTLYEKNEREMLHSKRVSVLCENIAKYLGFDDDAVKQMKIAGLMHDIGKIGIDEKILNKPGKLTDEEWNEMKKHSEIGYRLLSSVNEFSEISRFVLEHQEKWDGTGYPQGLKREGISIEARIISVADAFDAMTGIRTYKDRLTKEEAIKELKECAGSHFDPKVVEIFESYQLGSGGAV